MLIGGMGGAFGVVLGGGGGVDGGWGGCKLLPIQMPYKWKCAI